MGYVMYVRVMAGKQVTTDMMQAFRDTVPDYKACPAYAADPCDTYKTATTPTGLIVVAGSWSLSGHRLRPFVERMIRYFGKVHDIKLSADWKSLS